MRNYCENHTSSFDTKLKLMKECIKIYSVVLQKIKIEICVSCYELQVKSQQNAAKLWYV